MPFFKKHNIIDAMASLAYASKGLGVEPREKLEKPNFAFPSIVNKMFNSELTYITVHLLIDWNFL